MSQSSQPIHPKCLDCGQPKAVYPQVRPKQCWNCFRNDPVVYGMLSPEKIEQNIILMESKPQ